MHRFPLRVTKDRSEESQFKRGNQKKARTQREKDTKCTSEKSHMQGADIISTHN